MHRVGERRFKTLPGGNTLVERQPATVVDSTYPAGSCLELSVHLGRAFGGVECRVRVVHQDLGRGDLWFSGTYIDREQREKGECDRSGASGKTRGCAAQH